VVNIGNDKLCTVLELAQLIIKLTGSSSKIVHLPPLKEGDMTRRQPDNSKMREILGRPLITLEDGLNKMISSRHFLSSIGL
jgi:nucleoside-diphosphate-sugar epimerase